MLQKYEHLCFDSSQSQNVKSGEKITLISLFLHRAENAASYQRGLLSVGVFEVDGLQAQMLLDSDHVGLPGCLQQAVTSELICQRSN